MLKADRTKRELDKFAKSVIQQSRSRLTKGNNNATKKLYNSLDYKLEVGKNSFSLSFEMEDYGDFIDQGVSGIKRKFNTPFQYKDKRPPSDVFAQWSKAKGIKPRDKKTGKFITNKSFGFIMSRHIYEQGIKPTKFFSKSFEQQFEKISDDLTKAFNLDLDDFLNFTLQ